MIKEVKATRSPHGKTKQFFYSEKQLNRDFEHGFTSREWEEGVGVIEALELTADFRKEKIQVEVQFGNAARFYADVMKFQLAYLQDQAILGVEIAPKLAFAKQINDNIVNFERCKREIDLFKFAITVPIWIVGIEPESNAHHMKPDAESIRHRRRGTPQLGVASKQKML